jgi:hypothetical protein
MKQSNQSAWNSNQRCALGPDLESILCARVSKNLFATKSAKNGLMHRC